MHKINMTKNKPRFVPLSNSFFFTSIVGFYISVIYIAKKWPDFGIAFAIVFGIMFFASIISFTYAPANALVKLDEFEQTHSGAKLLSYKEYRKKEKEDYKKHKTQLKNAKRNRKQAKK